MEESLTDLDLSLSYEFGQLTGEKGKGFFLFSLGFLLKLGLGFFCVS